MEPPADALRDCRISRHCPPVLPGRAGATAAGTFHGTAGRNCLPRRIGPQADHFDAMAQRFRETRPAITVRGEHFPGGEYYEKIQALVAGGVLGDALWTVSIANFYPLASAGVLIDHRGLISARKFDAQGLFPQAMQGVSLAGKVYGLPWIVHPGRVGLFYNKAMFDQAGLPYPDATWTYETLLQHARLLSRAPDQFGVQTTRELFGMIVVIRSFGADYLSADGRRQNLDSPQVIEALQYVADLYGRHQVAPVTGNVNQMFNTNKLAMIQNGYWGIRGLTDNAKDVPWAVAPLPRGVAGLRGMFEFDPVSVTKFSKHPEAAFDYLAFLTSLEAGLDIAKRGSVPGARQAVWEHPELTKDPNHMTFAQIIKSTPPLLVPANFRFLEIQNEINKALAPLWSGQLVDVKALVKELAPKVQYILDQPPP